MIQNVASKSNLDLAPEKVANHLATGKVGRLPQGREVESAGQAIREAEEQHRRDPTTSILHSKAAIGHLVLLHITATEVVDAAGRIDLGLVLARHVSPLLARQDVEIVVCGVPAGVTFRSDSSAKDDEVLGNA